jgi:hypothetical protein
MNRGNYFVLSPASQGRPSGAINCASAKRPAGMAGDCTVGADQQTHNVTRPYTADTEPMTAAMADH